ncbi:MAG: hypothetical protein A2V45_15640 [Candidatus Aminicenantes bacterium RBG_19FT_COMBO_58_17]|nr:MAG: hypothetical protein A2V45_15640 [Candidatus Aminicenantes bacterium RBG_19FT_COMBO_58_17]
MRIENWDLREQLDTVEVSADIDGFRLWYRLPKSYPVSRAGDPFLAAALLPAMAKGEKLEIDPSLTVSPTLLGNTAVLQEVHHTWNPLLKIIPIQAKTTPVEPINPGAFSFFSGGVDSMFTFLKHQEELSHAVFIHGFDFFLDRDTFRIAVERNAAFLGGFGKTLIPVETNFYLFGYNHNLSRTLTQGSTLASVALLLGFPRAYVPTSLSYNEIFPSGSHPVTDPLWSNEGVQIIHDGAEARRVDKVRRVTDSPSALANLWVCLEDMNVNCGKCAKCLRTMISLELVGASAVPFPALPTPKALRRVNWKSEPIYLKENVDLALHSGNKELRRTLSACLRKIERRQLLKDMDRVLLGGLIKRARRKISKANPEVRRITAAPPED